MNKKKFLSILSLLILLDQAIKLIINQFFYTDNFKIIGDYIQFQPYLNIKYSWINSLFNLGISRILHIIVVVLMIIVISVGYKFIQTVYTLSKVIDYLFLFVLAGAACSLFDKVFWGGSLDYIMLKGLFIFDLKDVYISVFEILLVIVIIVNFKRVNKINEKQIFADFKRFIHKEIKSIRN
ncbi:MAG: signal peptidase II [Mobilitalea sp.]